MAGFEGDEGRRDRDEHYLRAVLRHPLRRRIMRLMSDRREVGAHEIAKALDEPLGEISYHLGVLVTHSALQLISKEGPTPNLYRWSLAVDWAREMLNEDDE